MDGELQDEDSQSGQINEVTDNRILHIGSDVASGNFFQGIIDEVRVYEQPLMAGEIKRHYVEGFRKLKLAGKDI